MNIVNKLTLRNLIKNKRRTLVTIIGVIISVAMVTAVSTLAVSFLDLMKKQSIADNGEWHLRYNYVTKEQAKAIINDGESKEVIISTDDGYAFLDKVRNEFKPYLFLKRYNEQGFKIFPIDLTDGRLPTNPSEVVISDHISKNGGVTYEIGDTITIDVGERQIPNFDGEVNQTFGLSFEDGVNEESIINTKNTTLTVVGIIKRPTWEPAWAPGYTIISYIDEELINDHEKVNATVILKNVDRSLYNHAEKLAEANNIHTDNISYNSSLLRYYGISNNDNLNKTLFSLSAIIMSVIIVGSVSLIYNAFAISVSERSRQLGMLASVGATKRQKRNSVFFEGAIIGLISIPIGILSGLAGIGITFYFINSMIQGALGVTEKLTLTVTATSILVAVVISILTIFISTYIPARRASKVSAIDAIRQSMDVKLSGKAVKTSKLVRKIFGMEAEIGLKNLKRNKKRYIATIFSLVISIILFLTVAFFTDSLKETVDMTQTGIAYDIRVSDGSQDKDEWNRLTKSIIQLDEVNSSVVIEATQLSAWISEDEAAAELKEHLDELEDGYAKKEYPYHVIAVSLDDKSLQDYVKEVGIDISKLEPNETSLPAIVINSISTHNGEKYVKTNAINTEIGRKIKLYNNHDLKEATFSDQIEVAALTDKYPMGVEQTYLGGLTIIVSDSSLKQLSEDNYANYMYLTSSDPLKTQTDIEELNEDTVYIHNYYQSRQEEQQLITILQVFTYGFIALITAISVANIFNTISTSISLRKREFAMLKSVGMTPKGFNKMINYESIFYGVKSLLYGIPLSIGVMYLIYNSMKHNFDYKFTLPWASLIFVIIAIFVIVGSAMLYSSSKVKKENIIDALKQENI